MTPADITATPAGGSAHGPAVMTDLPHRPPSGRSDIDEAVDSAEAAARTSGTHVRSLESLADLAAVQRLYAQIWRPDGQGAPVASELLRAMAKAGNYVGGAFAGEELVGACLGFFGTPASEALHSHIAGVSAGARGRNVGWVLKVHQRAWALLRGVREISWTFDPLVARNAYFNIAKLAADPVEYLPNFYGPMNDGINGAEDSDRLLISWPLSSPDVAAACRGTHRAAEPTALRAAVPALARSASGAPVAATPRTAPTLLVAVPGDIEAMRATDPRLAASWRGAVRDVLGGLLAEGARVRGFDRAGNYVVQREEKL
jgi:predicted GNAT superfamily acetyltransferase